MRAECVYKYPKYAPSEVGRVAEDAFTSLHPEGGDRVTLRLCWWVGHVLFVLDSSLVCEAVSILISSV